MAMLRTYFNWSSGKDAALALNYLLQDPRYKVECLLTTVNAHFNRVSMHGLRIEMLEKQVKAIGLPSYRVALPESPSNGEYEKLMGQKVEELKAEGIRFAAFGDIFLEDLRDYRERQLAQVGIKTVFPLWNKDTTHLIHDFLEKGFKAIVVCVNAAVLDVSFVGRVIDTDFINDLPEGVDPCGENGEFHTFCFDAPYFKEAVGFTIGEKVYREYNNGDTTNGFWFCDLIPLEVNE